MGWDYVTLACSPVAGATAYKFIYKQVSSATWDTITDFGTVVWVYISGSGPLVDYEYQVQAICDTMGSSNFSNSVYFQTGCNAPGVPVVSNLTSTSADISWGRAFFNQSEF
jgi:hypothetical protein